MNKSQEILNQWRAKKAAADKRESFEGFSTESLALIALAAILKINGIQTDSPLFPVSLSPTERASVKMEIEPKPKKLSPERKELLRAYAEAAQDARDGIGFSFMERGITAKEFDHLKPAPVRMVWGIDPAEHNKVHEARERLAERLLAKGRTSLAREVLAMHGEGFEQSLTTSEHAREFGEPRKVSVLSCRRGFRLDH